MSYMKHDICDIRIGGINYPETSPPFKSKPFLFPTHGVQMSLSLYSPLLRDFELDLRMGTFYKYKYFFCYFDMDRMGLNSFHATVRDGD